MKVNKLIIVMTSCLITTGLMLLGGCGGGGGGSAPPATVVTGTASKGPIKNGTVKIYGVSVAGAKGATPLATVPTDASGNFGANLGGYSGALVAEVSGEYTDEATGQPVTIPATSPLRAAIAQVDNGANNNRKIAITPLTHLACGMMGTTYTATAITAANNRVGDLFKVRDIVGSLPVQPIGAVMGGILVDDNQRTYTMALATLSQMAKDSAGGAAASYNQIEAILASFKLDMDASSTSGLSIANMSAFTAALATVSTNMLPGFPTSADNLKNAGTTSFKLTIEAANIAAGSSLGSLEGIINVPAGVDMRTSDSGQVLDGLITATGTAATGSPLIIGNYDKTTRQLKFSVVNANTAFGNGDCAIITFDVTAGTTVTAANFTASSVVAKNYDSAATVPGVTINLK